MGRIKASKEPTEVVIYADPGEGVVRIISAREATRREQDLFRDHMDRKR